MNSSLYGSERSGDTYWRSYLGLKSTVALWTDNYFHSLDLHSNLRWTGDLATKDPGTPQTYIYDSHLRLKGYPAGSIFYIGRQFAYNTLGSSFIDGLRIKLRFLRTVSFDLFGGATVSHETPDRIQSLSNDNLLGSRIGYSRSQSFGLNLNWLLQKSNGSITRHRAGIDVSREIRHAEFYSRISYDLLDIELADILARLAARPADWYLSAEFHWRKPSVSGNTIFGLIDADAYKGIRAEVIRTLWRNVSLMGQFHLEMFNGADSWRSVFGLRTAHFTMAWHHRDGRGGESDGFEGQANLNVRHNLEAFGSAFISKYLIQPETPGKIDAYSSSAGLLWRPGWALQVRVEGQYLKSAVDNNDFRMFLNLAKYFRISAIRSDTRT